MQYENSYLKQHNVAGMLAAENMDRLSTRRLSVRDYQDALVSPAANGYAGLYSNGRVIEGSNFFGGNDSAPKEDAVRDESVFYLGMIYGCWGHAITDGIKWAWPLIFSPEIRSKCSKFVYVTADKRESLPDNYFRFLEKIGIDVGKIERIDVPTWFRTVFYADPSIWTYRFEGRSEIFYTREFANTISCLDSCGVAPHRTVLLSRGAWKSWKGEVGNDIIEAAIVEKLKCEVVRPETLTFDELLSLLQETKHMIATEGSISHNAIFLPYGAKLTIIRKVDYINDYQLMINQIRKLDVTYIDANSSFLKAIPSEPCRGPFLLHKNSCLARYLGDSPSISMMSIMTYLIAFLRMRTSYLISCMIGTAARMRNSIRRIA